VVPIPRRLHGGQPPAVDFAAGGTLFDRLIELLLVGLVVFAPSAIGANDPWSEQVVIAVVAAVALCFCLKLLLHPQTPFIWSWTYLPIALFLLLVLFQLLPLPLPVISRLSPGTVALKTHLLSDISSSPPQSMALSFYSWATCHDLRLLLAIVAIYVVCVNVFCTSRRIKRLLAGISIAGGLVCLLALAQDLSGTDKIYWLFWDPYILKATAGPFAHYNHYSQFMNVAVGAAIGLLLVLMEERRIKGKSLTLQHRGRVDGEVIALICLGVFICLGMASVYLSRSRSGALSLTAAVCAALVPFGRRWGRVNAGWTALMIGALVFTVVLLAGFETVTSRLITLRHPVAVSGGRLQILRDILIEWRSFPIFGTGLGTHVWVYPRFISFPSTYTYTHAENEFAQMLEETGVVGLSLVVCFLAMIWTTVFRLLWRPERPLHAAVYGLGVAILAVNIQSFADFGQHLSANATLFSIVLALVVSIARLHGHARSREGDAPVLSSPARSRLDLGLRWVLLASVVAVFGWGLLGADRSRRARAAFAHAQHLGKPVIANGWQASDADYADIIDSAWVATQIEPDAVEYRYWLGLYQWNKVLRKHDPNLPDDAFSESDKKFLARLVEEFNATRRLCPTYGVPASVGGQISFCVLDNPRGADAIRISTETAGNNPWVAEIAASMYVKKGDLPHALDICRHYLTLEYSGPPLEVVPANIAEILVHEAKRPDLAIQLVGDNPDRLDEIVSLLRAETDRADFGKLASELATKSHALRRSQLEAACKSPDASAVDLAALAAIYASEHDPNGAIACYQRALVKDYGNVEWRVALARVLLANGQRQEAMDEAGICLRLHPESPEARKLISDASSPNPGPEKQ
jgi:O-antigen ligase/tetratricopeptide (TPR) repeat protein